MNIGFIGMGNMAKAIAQGFINSKKITKNELFAFAPNQEKLILNSQKIGFIPCSSLQQVVQNSQIIIFACKPYQITQILNEIQNDLQNKAIISIAAGWIFDDFNKILQDKVRIQCIMPNTPSMIGEGVLLFEEKSSLNENESFFVKELFSSLGIIETLETSLMGIGGAISGCGPAFMDLIMESYADAAVKYGIPREIAYKLVSQTMSGSAKLQQITQKHPGILKDEVCSPGGTTICGVDALEKKGLRSACISSIDAIMEKKAK